jgi:hypothetical protein
MKTRLLSLLFTGVLLGFQPCAAQTPVVLATSNAQQPSINTITQVGVTGGTQYCYWVVTVYTGGKSGPAGPLCTGNSNATLSTSNYNTIAFSAPTSPLAAVSSYDLLRTTTQTPPTGACACAVSTAQSGSPLNDQSNTLSAYTVATLASVAVQVVGDNVTSSSVTQATFEVNGTKVMNAPTALGVNFPQGVAQISTAQPFTSFFTFPVALVGLITSTTDVNGTIWFSQLFIPNSTTLTGICVLAGGGSMTDSWVGGLYNSAGVLVANTALAGTALATASAYNCVAFTATVAVAGPQTYYAAFQGNGTTAGQMYIYGTKAAPTNYGTGNQTGVFGTMAAITPNTTFTAAKGPVMSVY